MACARDGLPVLLCRCAKIVHILRVKPVRIPLILDLVRIKVPDMMSTSRAKRSARLLDIMLPAAGGVPAVAGLNAVGHQRPQVF